LGERVGDAAFETLVNTLDQSHGEVEAEKPGDAVRDVEAKALADTLPDSLAEKKTAKVGETLTALRAASAVVTLPHAGRDKGRDSCQNSERCGGPDTGRHAFCHTIRGSGQENWGHTNLCKARDNRRNAS